VTTRRLTWPAIALAIVGGTLLLQRGGHLARLENAVAETRATVLRHKIDTDIVIVGIDARSLKALDEWPWPRRHHARLLQMLRAAEPSSVFIDVDFGSRSDEEDDGLLEAALAEIEPTPVFLATHFQPLSGSDTTLTVSDPLPRFTQHARTASVVLEPDADGLVRTMRSSWRIGERVLPSIFSYATALPPETSVPIDYSIDPASFDYISYADLLGGRIDSAALRGKSIYVGPTANELRDVLPVPVYRVLPGVVVQAFAAASARGGVLRAPPSWLTAALLLFCAGVCAAVFGRRSWRFDLACVAGAFAVLGAATLLLYSFAHTVLEVMPFVVVIAALFVAATARSLDRETWRALAYAFRLKRRGALLTSVVESSSDSILCIDGDGIVRSTNSATSRLFGTPHGALRGAHVSAFIPSFGVDGAGVAAIAGSVVESTARPSHGGTLPIEVSVSKVSTEAGLFVVVIRDVTERLAQRRALEHQATHDPLTGLPNRTAFLQHLSSLLAKAQDGRRVALLMLDLDRFKEVNDTLGHDVGDDVLREVARRFSSALDDSALISRIGGDEFTVVVAQVEQRYAVERLCARLVDSLRAPIAARGVAIEVGVSVGMALSPDHSRDAKELLRLADVAMYVAKRNGTTFEVYDREHDKHTVRRLGMLSELRAAIEQGGMRLHYQPQVNLRTGKTESVEALVRWHHHTHGDVDPAEFVTLAEATDLIRPLTDWTLRQALADLASWNKRQLSLRVGINISARVIQDVDFPRRLEALIRETGTRAGQIELEITESAMLVDPERARRIVRSLHSLGVLIAIDDYGTGFSSLGYLRDLRVHALKLDKSFVVDLEARAQNRVIVESTVQMAHALGLRVVAEGVETEWAKRYLESVGYDLGQGFWFARAMSATDCCAWVERFNDAYRERLAV
jgi:diguanylate cyclase (GGDEF)-like protein/PAS domain S-box-containing protein